MRAFLLPVLLLAAAAADGAAVRRCLSPEGVTIYTDKRCDFFDARELPSRSRPGAGEPAIGARPPGNEFGAQGPVGSPRPLHAGCPARTAERIAWQIDFAHGLRDVNRLSALYHWTGTSDAAARPILEQLQRIAEAPALRVELLDPVAMADPYHAYASYAPTPQRGVLPSLRVEVGQQAGPAVQAIDFDLVRHAGCVWLTNLR